MQEVNKGTVLLTGASSGIGADLARLFAKDGYNLVLVARSNAPLEAMAAELSKQGKISVHIIPKDLSQSGAAEELYNDVQKQEIHIDILVNNAGFGLFGEFVETEWEKEFQMIQLNILTLTHLTKLFLPDMVKAKSGKILNIASTAAFQPGPLMAVYYASKSYVLLFSEAIANELQGSGVTVTALCPGPTRSGFQKAAEMERSRLIKGKIAQSDFVAQIGYFALMRGDSVVIPGLMNKLMAQSIRFLPRKLATSLSKAAIAPV